jgi:hypothetical protein
MITHRTLSAVAIAGGVALFAAGCNETRDTGAVTTKTDEGTSTAPGAEAVEERDNALVRVVHAIPGGSASIYAGDSAAFSNLSYKSVSDFREMPDDAFGFKVVPSGGSAENPIGENREKLSNGGHYTIIAMPDEGGDGKANLRVLDDELKPLTDGKARIRVVHAVAGAGEIDVFARGQDEPLFDDVNFKSEAGWREVDPFTGTLEVRRDDQTAVIASVKNVKVEAGKSYTYVIAGPTAKPDVIAFQDDVAVER